MVEKNSPVVIAIVLVTLGALWIVLRAVVVWAAPPSTGPRRQWPMFTSPEAAIDAGPDGDGGHHHGGWGDQAGDAGSYGGDAGGGDGGH